MKLLIILYALFNPRFWKSNARKFRGAIRSGWRDGEQKAKQDVDAL